MKKFKNDQDYLRDFFENAPIGFHAFGPNRIIVDMNQTELDMLGYAKKDIVGKKCWTDLIDPAEIPLFEKHWQEINSEGEVRNLNYTLVCRGGRRRKVLLNASARFDLSGKLLNTRGSVVDITQRQQMTLMLAASKEKASRYKSNLEKNNTIFLNWLDKWDEEKHREQENIRKNIEETVFPLLEKLKRRGTPLDRRNLLLLERSLQDVTSGFALKLMNKKWRLSVREIEICKMLTSGLKTKDIADLLSTSSRTIEHHRNHIRKKLGMANSSDDPAVFLKTFSM